VERYGVLHDGKDVVICDKHPLANINYCDHCEQYVEEKVENLPMYDERRDVCESCKEELGRCDHCEQWFDQQMDGYVYCEDSGNTYCDSCVGNGVTYFCYQCGYDYDDDESVYVDNRIFCKECFEGYYYTCKSCGKPVRQDDAKMVITPDSDDDGDPYCELCADNMDAFIAKKRRI
jgi:hypothetical protein